MHPNAPLPDTSGPNAEGGGPIEVPVSTAVLGKARLQISARGKSGEQS